MSLVKFKIGTFIWLKIFFYVLLSDLTSNLREGHRFTFGFCCPNADKVNASMNHLRMILQRQPVDDSTSIYTDCCFTYTRFKSHCTDRFNPRSSRRVGTWTFLCMAQRHVDLNLLWQKRIFNSRSGIFSFSVITQHYRLAAKQSSHTSISLFLCHFELWKVVLFWKDIRPNGHAITVISTWKCLSFLGWNSEYFAISVLRFSYSTFQFYPLEKKFFFFFSYRLGFIKLMARQA